MRFSETHMIVDIFKGTSQLAIAIAYILYKYAYMFSSLYCQTQRRHQLANSTLIHTCPYEKCYAT